jgi:hypothetical protein
MPSLGRFAYALASGVAITCAQASDLPATPDLDIWWVPHARPIPQWESEFGGRYWFSTGQTQLDIYGGGVFSGLHLSRLTYTNLDAHSGEFFGRVEHLSGFFIKGFAGGGAITSGNLQDEDFPPVIVPYSSTNSDQRGGRLAYATIDAGWTWRSETSKLGFFAGYNYFHQVVNAFGCTQTASNPFVCVPSIPSSSLVITDDANWNAIRLGFNGQWNFWGGFAFDLDFAWLPAAWLTGNDTHSFTVFKGPEHGSSGFSSVEIEALLRYRYFGLSVGVGGRFWNIDTTTADIDPITGFGQTISVHSQRWGPFVQASYKFGELRPSRY